MGGNKRKPRTKRTVDSAGDCAPALYSSNVPSSPRSKRARLAKLASDGRPGGAAANERAPPQDSSAGTRAGSKPSAPARSPMHEAIAAAEATVAAENSDLERRLAAEKDKLRAVAGARQPSRRLTKKERRRQTANEAASGVEDSTDNAGAGRKREREAPTCGKAADDQKAAELVVRGTAAARKAADKHESVAALKRKAAADRKTADEEEAAAALERMVAANHKAAHEQEAAAALEHKAAADRKAADEREAAAAIDRKAAADRKAADEQDAAAALEHKAAADRKAADEHVASAALAR